MWKDVFLFFLLFAEGVHIIFGLQMPTMSENKYLTIKSWLPDDRPREKMLLKGSSHVTDTELLAILLGSGTRHETVMDLSRKLLASANNDLSVLSRFSIAELVKIKGIGKAKALTIAAAFELGRRRNATETMQSKEKFLSSSDVAGFFRMHIGHLPHEEFWVLLLNRSNHLIEKIKISQGGISGTTVDIRIMLKQALEKLASALIICHNHPSGNIKPSEEDISLTKKIKEAGKIMDIRLLDHVIVSDCASYFSFADEGLI